MADYFEAEDAAFARGVNMDLRARLAQQLMVALITTDSFKGLRVEVLEGAVTPKDPTPRRLASRCCDVADALVEEWEQRAWLKPGITLAEQAKLAGRFAALRDAWNRRLTEEAGREEPAVA